MKRHESGAFAGDQDWVSDMPVRIWKLPLLCFIKIDRSQNIKCDPTNPKCKRFVSTTWSSNRSLEHRSRSKPEAALPSWLIEGKTNIRSLDQTWHGTLKERQSLHFFSIISAPELSGLLDSQFWQMMLLQAAQSDDAIKHAVAAIGASHEHQLRRQASRINAETDGLRPFALRQCNKAITALVKPAKRMDQHDLKRALTAAVLLACFESVAGNRDGAVPHVVHSRRLLEQYKHCQASRNPRIKSDAFPIDLDVIEPLITHYEVQVGGYAGESDPSGMIKKFSLTEPFSINRIADARVSLEGAIASLSVVLWNLQHDHSPEAIELAEKQKFAHSSWLQDWDRKFTHFLARSEQHLDKKTFNGCRLIKAHHLTIYIVASITWGQGGSVWASFTPNFATIIDLLTAILDNSPKKAAASTAPQTPYISATMGMTEPLYVTLSRCVDEGVVKRARELVGRLPMNEGIHSEWRTGFVERALRAAEGREGVEGG